LNKDFVMTATYIARSSAIASRVLAGETMVMSVSDSTFFTLNEVASAIWKAADGVTPLDEIVTRHVCAEFDIPSEEALTDATHFVRELSAHGILQVSDQPIFTAHVPSAPASAMETA
jgi:hypothetical protein